MAEAQPIIRIDDVTKQFGSPFLLFSEHSRNSLEFYGSHLRANMIPVEEFLISFP